MSSDSQLRQCAYDDLPRWRCPNNTRRESGLCYSHDPEVREHHRLAVMNGKKRAARRRQLRLIQQEAAFAPIRADLEDLYAAQLLIGLHFREVERR